MLILLLFLFFQVSVEMDGWFDFEHCHIFNFWKILSLIMINMFNFMFRIFYQFQAMCKYLVCDMIDKSSEHLLHFSKSLLIHTERKNKSY